MNLKSNNLTLSPLLKHVRARKYQLTSSHYGLPFYLGALEYGEDYYYDGDNQEDYYQYDYDDSIFDESFNGSGLTRTPR